MEVPEAARLKAREDEKAKLKRLLADTMLDHAVWQEVMGWGISTTRSRYGRSSIADRTIPCRIEKVHRSQ